jgi:WhiB family redox-sensing transcriptional regulator
MALDQTAQPTTSRLTPMEVTPMQLTVLDRTDEQDAVAALSAMTGLSALSGRVVAEQLPCRVNDPELFFAESPADVEYAKTLCATCPARQDCLNGALERREPWGVWGGEWFVQGVVVPRKRPRGRPRKFQRRQV